jgi:autotransporter-associated beta strand protein
VTCAFRYAIVLIAVTSFAQFSAAANYTVTTGSGSGTNSLAWAINSANAAGAGPHTITVSPSVTTISVSASLPIINANVSIEGHGTKIVGNNQQLFVVNSGTVSLRDMNVTGGRALGGTGGVGNGGGGGGLGWGGGLFVNAGARVTIENVTFDSNRAQGGAGGGTSSAEGGGGGGGFRGAGGTGGNGSNIGGGGGGGGLVGRGGNGSTGGGGGGGGGTSNGSNGSGANGGNGNGGGGKGGNSGSGGAAGATSAGGGGGGGQSAGGGSGNDFGGGGGGGGLKAGGAGGFGAGGGGAGVSSTGGAAGFGGGAGGDAGKKGAGGSGYGGAVFVRQGGSLTVINSSMTANNSVVAGAGSASGQTAGSNLYVMSGVNATFGGTGNSQLAGSISGDGGLVKNDSGTLNLSGANDYTGGTTVNGGVLRGTTDSIQGDFTNNASVTLDQSASGSYTGSMTGSGSLTKAGAGTVTLSGTNSYAGGTTVSGGKLLGSTSSLQGNMANNANVEFSQSTSGTYSGAMNGSGALIKSGTGTVTLSGPNSYSGGTTVSGGALRGTTTSLQGNITNNATTEFDQNTNGNFPGTMSGSGALVKSGTGKVTLAGPNTYTGGTTVSGGTLQGTTLSLQGNIANNASVEFNQSTSGTFAGIMSGSGTLVKSGTGTVTLAGPNTYSGGTTVSGGELQGTTSSLQGNITNNANVEFNQNSNGDFAGSMTGSGALVKSGTGAVTLSGPNSYSGGTTVNGGTLRGTIASLQGDFTNNAKVEFDQNSDGTYAGAMNGSGTLMKNGSGTVTLSGPNSYTGGTTVNAGTLRGTTTSLQGNITNNAITEFDQNTSGTFAGTISGSGALVNSGSGTVTLSSPNSYAGGTTVNAGTLRGTTASLQGNITNDAKVEFDQNSDGTFAGVINGSGGLAKSGSGIVTLTGPNSYSGGTTVNAGTLKGTTSSLQGEITNYGNIEFDQNTNGTYTGTVYGSGALVKSGTGIVTLTALNAYSGGTTVNGGTLRGTTDSLQGNITNNAHVEYLQTTDGTYAGTMTGSGSLVKEGSATLTLAGPNSYTGGTTVNDGLLQGDATSLQGDITNNAHVTFDQAADGTYAGVISGTGGLTKSGASLLNMTGLNTYSGTTDVAAGHLVVNGSLTGDVMIASGASLGGNGTIHGDVSNSGTIGAGNSIGTMTLAGVYTQQAGSVLEVEINDGGTTPGVNNDLIQANSVVLNGGTVSVLAAPGNYLAGSQYRFLSSHTAIVGQFDAIMIDSSAYAISLGYDYDAGLYWAYFTFASEFTTFAQTANQLAIANYLDSISTGATGDLQFVLDGVNSLAGDAGAMQAAFDTMTDQAAPTLATVGLQNTTLVMQQLAGQLRSGNLGVTGGGMALSEPAARATSGPVVLVSYNKGSAPTVSFVSDEIRHCWKGWTLGYGLGGSAVGDGNAAGLTYGMGGTLLGLDRSLGDEGRLGFFGGYQGTGLRLANLTQSGSINGGMLGSYLYHDDGFNYYSAITGLQFNGYDTTRQIVFDGVDRTARGTFSGWQGYGYLERGVNLRGRGATLQPYAALQYIYLRQNSYTETGADTLNLSNSGIDANSLRSLVGCRLQSTYTTRGGHFVYPELRALWLHEFLATNVVVNSFFAPIGGSSFATQGLNLGRDWAIVGGGMRYELPQGWQLMANYDVQVNSQQVFHVGSGSLQYAW